MDAADLHESAAALAEARLSHLELLLERLLEEPVAPGDLLVELGVRDAMPGEIEEADVDAGFANARGDALSLLHAARANEGREVDHGQRADRAARHGAAVAEVGELRDLVARHQSGHGALSSERLCPVSRRPCGPPRGSTRLSGA